MTAVKGSTVTVSGITVSPGKLPANEQVELKLEDEEAPAPKTETLKVTTSGSTPVSATQTAARERSGRR